MNTIQCAHPLHHHNGFVATSGGVHALLVLEPTECSTSIYHIYMVFITEGLFEVAIESWPEWDLNPRPLNSVQTL